MELLGEKNKQNNYFIVQTISVLIEKVKKFTYFRFSFEFIKKLQCRFSQRANFFGIENWRTASFSRR